MERKWNRTERCSDEKEDTENMENMEKITLSLLIVCIMLLCATVCHAAVNADTASQSCPENEDIAESETGEGESLTAYERLERFKDCGINGFIRTEGESLVDGNGNQYLIKGMAFGNEVWSNSFYAPSFHHDEESYAELKELGFNCVRFYLNYGLFERDSKPYVYSQSGWDWLDKNIEWAGKQGIRLILNMHYPQGGYQSESNGMQLWQDPECQKRLAALWKEIARRYKDEPVIIGYGLVNEPVVPKLVGVEESFDQWKNLAEELIGSIREVDTNHIVFVERLHGIKDIKNNSTEWDGNFNGDMDLFLVNDENAVYEFHFYDPFYFTHQDDQLVGTAGMARYYPDEDSVLYSSVQWAGFSSGNPKADVQCTQWQYLEGEKIKVSNDKYKLGEITLRGGYLGKSGKVYYDDLIISEFDENGELVKESTLTFDANTSWNFGVANGVGLGGYYSQDGHAGRGCLYVQGTSDDANIGCFSKMFLVKQGYSYQISGWVKAVNAAPESNITLSIDFWDAEDIRLWNKDTLESAFLRFLEFGRKNNVPLYLGEFGAISGTFKDGRGGGRWVEDILDICRKYGVGFNYHAYHEERFGLWNSADAIHSSESSKNEVLTEVFRKALSEE